MFRANVNTMEMMMGSMCMMPCFDMPCSACFSYHHSHRALRFSM
jgi:hypothetical protein